MSLELPPASSLNASRRLPKPRGRAKFAYAALGLVAVSIAAAIAIGVASRPRLESLEPGIGDLGAEATLKGRGFGAVQGDARVEAGGSTVASSAFSSWSDSEIRLKLPASFDSGLVYVITARGRSNPKLFMNRARLPLPAAKESGAPKGPRVDSIGPEEGCVGSLVTLTGRGFGEDRSESKVLFAWTADTEGGLPPEDRSSPESIAALDSDFSYESWSDVEIKVRIPDGAISGSVSILKDGGRSNGAFLRVFPMGGSKRLFSRARYSLSQSISIARVKASGPGELYLWAALPAESCSQRLDEVLGQEPAPILGDYRGTSLYRFADLATGSDRAVRQSFLVQVSAVEATIDPDRSPGRPRDPPALMAAYSAQDALVPSAAAAVTQLAQRISGGERESWRAARLVWDWLLKNLAWSDGRGSKLPREKALDALADRRADSYSYSIIAAALLRAVGLPARPVAGYLVEPNRAAIRHYWDEVYLYGLGWIPLDPILGSGASPGGFPPPWEDRSRYFGGLDDRHLAFSRGLSVLAPLSPAGRRVSRERRWSFQSFYEEASGAISAYSSFWGDVEVTGIY